MKAAAIALAGMVCACGGNSDCDRDAPGTICTIAGHSKDLGFAGDGGPATSATLYLPMDSAVSPDGEVWLIDFNNYIVRAIDAHGEIRTVVGNRELGDSPTSDGLTQIAALQSSNNHDATLAFHDGFLYLSAWHESRIKRVRLADMIMEDVAGRGVRGFYDGDGGSGGGDPLLAALSLPSGLAFDPAGNLVLTDQENDVVRRIAGGTISTIAGRCIVETATSTVAGGCVPAACPGSEKLVCGDPAALCSEPCSGAFAGDGGPALQARFDMPSSQTADPCGHLAFDAAGDLLIVDTGNERIRKIDTAGIITTIAGDGTPGYAGDGGPATQAQLHHPIDVAVGDDGTIYFSDTWNHCIRAIDASGTISTVAGTCHFEPQGGNGSFAGDGGPATEAQLDRPYGIDVAGKKLYVSDSYNNRLRVVTLP